MDPQKTHIDLTGKKPKLYDHTGGEINISVLFPFGHTPLDRNMTKMIVLAAELMGIPVVNGYKALTLADDKGLMALTLSKSGLPIPSSVIASARGNAEVINKLLPDDKYIVKTTGFTAGGVGTQPIPSDVDYLAPLLWSSRKDDLPKVIQQDIDKTPKGTPRTVVRAYIVGDSVIGAYTTKGFGIVNCAGLARESKAVRYEPSKEEARMYLKAAQELSCGFCRVDATPNGIFEVNPLARIDAEQFGINVAEYIANYCVKLANKNKR